MFTGFSIGFLFIYGVILGADWTISQGLGICFRILIGSSLIGLFISGIYQLIKKDWKESVFTVLILIGLITVIYYYFLRPLDCIQPKIVEMYPSGQIKKKIVYPFAGDTLMYSELSYYENGHLKSNIDFYKGRFNGGLIEYYDNGNTKFSGQTSLSMFYGIKYNYYEDGGVSQMDSLLGECKVNYCCCDAMITRYYPNGKVKEKATIVNGTFNGEAVFFHENGKIKMKRVYHLGSADGITTEYYEEYNIHGQYVNGKEDGEWKYIDSLGEVKRVDVYKNGVIIKYGNEF